VVIVCRDPSAARQRFGVTGDGIGICYTRTGRRFFSDAAMERQLLQRVNSALRDSDKNKSPFTDTQEEGRDLPARRW